MTPIPISDVVAGQGLLSRGDEAALVARAPARPNVGTGYVCTVEGRTADYGVVGRGTVFSAVEQGRLALSAEPARPSQGNASLPAGVLEGLVSQVGRQSDEMNRRFDAIERAVADFRSSVFASEVVAEEPVAALPDNDLTFSSEYWVDLFESIADAPSFAPADAVDVARRALRASDRGSVRAAAGRALAIVAGERGRAELQVAVDAERNPIAKSVLRSALESIA